MDSEFYILPAKFAFWVAIKSGNLSEDPDAENFAGYYMYMGNEGDDFLFKHIETRKYIRFQIE